MEKRLRMGNSRPASSPGVGFEFGSLRKCREVGMGWDGTKGCSDVQMLGCSAAWMGRRGGGAVCGGCGGGGIPTSKSLAFTGLASSSEKLTQSINCNWEWRLKNMIHGWRDRYTHVNVERQSYCC